MMSSSVQPKPSYNSISHIWQQFEQLLKIPRPSKNEQHVKDWIRSWAASLPIEIKEDKTGNLYLFKAATAGMENSIPVTLQAHLDMVYQANQNDFDPFQQPIHTKIENEWLIAPETTLGADNGIGLVLIMAALEDPHLSHGPLQAILTVDEEAGMSGALNLLPEWIQGDWLINLDTEEWGEVYIGCAGSQDAVIYKKWPTLSLLESDSPLKNSLFTLTLEGLTGGHSGIDIHQPFGNASVLLAKLLADLPLQLIAFSGGTARNAIPRIAQATFILEDGHRFSSLHMLENHLNTHLKSLTSDLQAPNARLKLERSSRLETSSSLTVLSLTYSKLFLQSIENLPNGVLQSTAEFPVFSSANLGMVELSQGKSTFTLMFRSFSNLQLNALISNFVQERTPDFEISLSTPLSAWQPDPSSALLQFAEGVFNKLYQVAPKRQLIHAGLECGLIQQHKPNLQLISFGPTIKGAHAPGERVHMPSVALSREYLYALLTAIPEN